MISKIEEAIREIEKVIRGKHETIELIFTAIIAGGHCLIEDLPGSGKTLLAKSIAKVFQKPEDDIPLFKRIQFTPDLLPSDILGVNIYNQSLGEFRFIPGPIFTRVLLADEINRAGPKVQSALLEAMAESQVTIDNVTYKLPDLFFVIATQNPLDIVGTHPLPIAQLDRFLLRIPLSYTDPDIEEQILIEDYSIQENFENIKPVLSIQDILALRQELKKVYVCSAIIKAIVEVGVRSRLETFSYGISTRALVLLKRCLQARALIKGRNFVTDKDFFDLLFPVLNHRLGVRKMDEAKEALKSFSSHLLKSLPNMVIEELKEFRLS